MFKRICAVVLCACFGVISGGGQVITPVPITPKVEVEWRPNYAAAANGGVASASSTLAGRSADAINDDIRNPSSNIETWVDNTNAVFPDWAAVTFAGARVISEIDVITRQDTLPGVEPDLTTVFSAYGIVDFLVQYWDGSGWVTVATVVGNDKVWRRFTFTAVLTTAIRVYVTAAADGHSRIIEIEAYGPPIAFASGPKTPANASGTAGHTTIGAQPWDTADYAREDDNFYTQVILNAGQFSKGLGVWNLGFAIPNDSMILGIAVSVKKGATQAGLTTSFSKLTTDLFSTYSGNPSGAGDAWPAASPAYYTYGGPLDLWGMVWTPAMINSVNFGFRLTVDSSTNGTIGSVDAIVFTVFWAPLSGWHNVSPRVLLRSAVTADRGKDQIRLLSPPFAGSAGAELDNRSMDYSSSNTASPLYGLVEPGKRMRITAEHSGTIYPVWSGIVDDLAEAPGRNDLSVGLRGLGKLARLVGVRVSTPLYESITIDQALNYLLDKAKWPPGQRAISASSVTLDHWWLAEEDAFGAMVDLLNTEGPDAAVYERADGWFVFEDRGYRDSTPRSSVSNHTFTRAGGINGLAYDPQFKDVINDCQLQIQRRSLQAETLIWEQAGPIVLAANESRVYKVNASDPFVAVVPVPVGNNTVQSLTPSTVLTSGNIGKLGFRGQVSAAALAWNATDADIQASLEALSTVGAGNVFVVGGPLSTGAAVQVVFVGTLGGKDIADLITIEGGTLNPATVAATIEVGILAEGGGVFDAAQELRASGVLQSGTFTIDAEIAAGGGTTGSLAYNASDSAIQAAIRAISGALFLATTAQGGPVDSAPVQIRFVTINEQMAPVTIAGAGLTASQPGASVAVTETVKGGIPDYALLAGSVTITVDPMSGTSVTITVTAGSGGSTLGGLRLRGRSLSVVGATDLVKSNVDASVSIDRFGLKSTSPRIRAEISRATAQTLANLYVLKYMNRRPVLHLEHYSDSGIQGLVREISDLITVDDSQTGINGPFWIERIGQIFLEGGLLHTVFGCESADPMPASAAIVSRSHVSVSLEAGGGGEFPLVEEDVMLLNTVEVDTDNGAAQELYTVPSDQIMIPTLVVVRGATADLSAMSDMLQFGFGAGASDWQNPIPRTAFAGILDDTAAIVHPRLVGSVTDGPVWDTFNPVVVGTAGDVFACKFRDASINGKVTIDVFGYLVPV